MKDMTCRGRQASAFETGTCSGFAQGAEAPSCRWLSRRSAGRAAQRSMETQKAEEISRHSSERAERARRALKKFTRKCYDLDHEGGPRVAFRLGPPWDGMTE